MDCIQVEYISLTFVTVVAYSSSTVVRRLDAETETEVHGAILKAHVINISEMADTYLSH